VAVVDSPPVFPNVNFVPFKNDYNNVSINIQSNGGEYSAQPVVLDSSDEAQFGAAYLNQNMNKREIETIRVTQAQPSSGFADSMVRDPSLASIVSDYEPPLPNSDSSFISPNEVSPTDMVTNAARGGFYRPGDSVSAFSDSSVAHEGMGVIARENSLSPLLDVSKDNVNPIHFRTDDPTTTFEVFRTDVYPESYEDFRGKKVYKIFGTADNATIVDRLVPNKNYYYIFRAEDVHGHVSNPTHVFEVRLNRHNEASYMDVKIVKPKNILREKAELESRKLGLRQFLMIRPALHQRILNLPSDGRFKTFQQHQIHMGPPRASKTPNVWVKKFKLRVRSKHTGKEIDIDFKLRVDIVIDIQNNGDNSSC
tara:strand:+ start:149 stop:1246 length:1098 start_codon:yes stop_codon:yes gene_type:complete